MATKYTNHCGVAPGFGIVTAGLWMLVLQLCCAAAAVAEGYDRVVIADPFIELRTGPGRGYPIFHVEERGASIVLLKRKTDWFKVRTDDDIEGWVDRIQLERTLNPSGGAVSVRDATFEDFIDRSWEFGVEAGDFDGSSSITAYALYAFSRTLQGEVSLSQILGSFSDSLTVAVDVLAVPFPEWRISPFFAVGTGVIDSDPRTVLVQTRDGTDRISHVGIGISSYLARHLMMRAEYRHYVIFTSRNDNEEAGEWRAGLAIFF